MTFTDVTSAVLALDHQILTLAAKTGRGLTVFHAAWAVRNNQAVILPGPGGTGKSTLCHALCKRGMACGSDEATAFLSNSGILIPFFRKMLFKPGQPPASSADSSAEPENVLCRMDGRNYIAPRRWASAAPYQLIFVFPHYNRAAPAAEAAALTTGQALPLLLKNIFRLSTMTQPLFSRLTRALGPGSAFQLDYSDTNIAADFILGKLGRK